MKISRLRLLGFKSFVEPTELLIEPGLTGVVGPNGCGKSNLLEALRWVMGETSHKSMRAAAMDDVIFSGTNGRPARNSAEVTIFLDNTRAQGAGRVQRQRRDRDHAAHRARGRARPTASTAREARARDVKILFEDAATGARSPALVRQGQIGEIVNAKPEQRRRILEDAAGIAGLHSRRHEAELRLKAAEANLARLNDMLGQLDSQIESLKRQARAGAALQGDLRGDPPPGGAALASAAGPRRRRSSTARRRTSRDALTALGAATQAEAQALRRGGAARRGAAAPARGGGQARRGRSAALTHRAGDLRAGGAARSRAPARAGGARRAARAATSRARKRWSREAREMLGRARGGGRRAARRPRPAPATASRTRASGSTTAETALKAAEARLAELTDRGRRARARSGRAWRPASPSAARRSPSSSASSAALDAQTREIAGRAPDAEKLAADHRGRASGSRSEIADIEAQAIAAEEKRARSGRRPPMRAREESANGAPRAQRRCATERETLAKLLIGTREDGLAADRRSPARRRRATRRRSAPRSATISRRRPRTTRPCTGGTIDVGVATMPRCRPTPSRSPRTSRRRPSSTAA